MPFIQKRPQIGDSVQFYTLGQHKTVLIVGLGNIGKEYEGTRHNVGFLCVEAYAEAHGFDPWINKKDLACQLASATIGGVRVLLIKPTTLMNLSGKAVQAAAHFYKVMPEHVLVVHDELDIPFGQIRTRVGGSSAGHNGIKSVSGVLGENYGRLRVGIGPKTPPQIDSADFVLARFSADEQAQLKPLTLESNAILDDYIFGGELPHETRSFIV